MRGGPEILASQIAVVTSFPGEDLDESEQMWNLLAMIGLKEDREWPNNSGIGVNQRRKSGRR
jgi:hypothetical protein